MKRILFLLCALLGLGVSGAWATDVTVIDKTQDASTYGTLSGTTFTTNEASGMAGVTIEGVISTTATNFAYGACLGFTSVSNGTVTMTAPDGYIITGYTFTGRLNTYAAVFTVTPSAGGKAKALTTGGVEVSATSLTEQSASFTYSCSSTNSWYIPSLVINVMSASAQTVNVTYELWDNGGSEPVSSLVSIQEANSEVSVPTAWTSSPLYSYNVSGTIGDSDCTIIVTRTKIGVTTTSELKNTKCYTIRTYDRGWWVVPASTSQVTSTTKASLATDASDVKQQFAFVSYEEKFYLYSVSEKKFISKSGQYTTLTSEPGDNVTLLASSGDDNHPTVVAFQDGAYQGGISNGYNPAIITFWNSLTDGGNRTAIIEATDFDASEALAALEDFFHPNYTVTYIVKDGSDNILFTSDPVGSTSGAHITTLPDEYQLTNFYTYNNVDVTITTPGNTNVEFIATPKEDALVKYTADATNPYYYNLNIRSKYLVYNSEATGEVTLQDTSEPFNADASWAFVGEPYAGFKVINKTKGSDYCLTYTSVVTARHSDNNVQFVAATECTDKYWVIDTNKSGLVLRMKENPSIYFHHDNINNYLRTCSVSEWSAVHDDAGSTIEAVSDDDVLFALYDSMKDYIYGDGLGKYTATGITADQAQNTILQAGKVITDENTANYAEAYKALNDLKSITAINQPSAGFYRIKSVANNTYLSGNASVVEEKTDRLSFTTTIDASNIFYFDGAKLYDFAKGRAANGRDVGIVGATGMNYEFETSSSEAGKYAICFTPDDGKKRWLYAHSSGYADQNGAEDQYCRYDLEEVNTLPVTISAAGYATLYAPVALTIPEGVTASTLTIGYKDHLDETNVEVTIPANTPVMLSGDNGNPATSGTYNFTIAEDVPAINQANELIGTLAAIAAPDESYILQNHDGVVGFYQVDTSVATPNVPGFRAYIPALDSSVKAFFFGDTATGINAIKDASVDGEIYDLSGRRVSKMQRGVYVVGGKKVAVK